MLQKIKFTNLFQLIPDKKRVISKVISCIKSSSFVGGKEVSLFEENFSKFVGSKRCVAVANGTDALEIAVKALNLKKGSEIIVPVNTWISTAEAVLSNNHKLIFCDINLDDYSICLKDLKKKITRKTRAIIAVHLYGNPSDMNAINKIIRGKNIKIIEDCAQAHGSKIKSKHVGTFGDIGTFSFFPGKNLGAFGDGGAIITKSKKIFEFCLRERNHGALNKYDHKFSGRNSRLDTINCGVLNLKLKHYKNCIKKRKFLANIYFNNLKNINQLKLFRLNKNNDHSFHQFVIRTSKRNKLRNFLNKNGVETMIHYPYMLNELKFFNYKKKLKNSHQLGKKILSLPISEEHKKSEIIYVAQLIKKFFSVRS
tara:strand:+ start:806 stop:1909 length:1104 start_codon:yes stop_codon:yes gene_type:complete